MPGNTAEPTSAVAAQLEKIVAKRIESDQLVVVPLPAVALKCLNLLKNPDLPLKEAAGVVEKDPVITAQLLKFVNSAAMAGREPIKSVLHAVTRIGAAKLRTFLIEISARRMFESRDPRISEASRGLWEHSLAVAHLTRDVVAFSNSGDPDFGYLGGLLHDIGKPIVAGLLLEAEKMVFGAKPNAIWLESREWIGVVQRVHRNVGVTLADRWDLPEPVKRSIRDCEEYDNSDRLSIANAVRFANALAKLEGLYVGDINRDDVEALVMIGRSLLKIDDELVSRLTNNLKNTVKSQLQ